MGESAAFIRVIWNVCLIVCLFYTAGGMTEGRHLQLYGNDAGFTCWDLVPPAVSGNVWPQ